MSAVGRNQSCRCGSRKATEDCCPVPGGTLDADLAESFLATEARQAALRLILLSEDERLDLFDEMLDLPARHLSLQLPVLEQLALEFGTLCDASAAGSDTAHQGLAAALERVDTPVQRADLARAVLSLAASGDIAPAVADAALLDLDCHPTSAILRTSLLHSLAVPFGGRSTRARLLVTSR